MGERLPEGTVTILFLDVVGSTALGVSAGDRVARERLRAREAAAREQLPRHRGRQIKGTGDGMMAAFTSARRAVDCAIDIQGAIERINLTQPKQAVQVRVGLHTGEVFAERGDLFGSAVNAAARIESLADPGGIFISDAVRMLLEPGADYRLRDRGEFALKGFGVAWRLFEVMWREARGSSMHLTRSPLVGREQERLQMSRWLDAAASGRGLIGLMRGEPGVGKSRLAQEAVDEAQARGFLTLTGHCYEMEGAPPYNAFVEILEAAAHALDDATLAIVLGDDAPQAAKLVPRLRERLPRIPAAPERPAALERRFLLDAVQGIVERLAVRQPLLLVFEDLHWIDGSTLVLFQHVVRRSGEIAVAILATYRDTEVFPERPFTAALGDLHRQPRTQELRVQRLTREAVGDLLRAYGGRDAPRRFLDLLIAETEGNVLFVEQVLKHLTELGRVFDAEGGWLKDVDIAEDEVPHGVKHIIARRLARVSADCRRVLTWAAILGRAFSYEMLRELADFVDDETLLGAMDEGEHALLIAPTTIGGEQRLAFAHELIRQTLLGDLSLPRRQRLHAQAAAALEGADAERHVSDIAQHLHLAGAAADAARTVRYLTLAGHRARAAAAFEDAHRSFDAALQRLPETAPERAELLYERGLAAFSAGRWELAEPDWSAALAAAERAGSGELAARVALDLGLQLGYAARPTDSFEVSRRGLQVVGGAASGARARLLAFYAMQGCDLRLHDYATAHDRLREAAQIAEAAHDRAAYGDVVGRTAHLYWRHALMAESAAHYERACALLDEAGSAYALAHARAWHMLALVALGRFADAAAVGQGLEQYCERVGDPGAVFATRRAHGYMDFAMTGNLARWNAFATADLAVLEALGSRFTANSHAAIAYGRFFEGRWDDALSHARKAQELAIDDSWAGASATALLLVQAYLDDRDGVRLALERERRRLPVAGRVNESGAWELLPAAVEALAVVGAREEAADLYSVAAEAAANAPVIRYVSKSLPQTTAGIAAACGQSFERAVEHFEIALRQAHALPHRLEQPEVRRWLAWTLLERDAPADQERARTLLDEACAGYGELGMPRHRALAAALRAGERRPR
jgi:predicted ATPase/class 3 adenylate cyclase